MLSNATVNRLGVRETKIKALITNGACSHEFYFDNADKNKLSILISAKATGSNVMAYFSSAGNSPDYLWGGLVSIHELIAVNF